MSNHPSRPKRSPSDAPRTFKTTRVSKSASETRQKKLAAGLQAIYADGSGKMPNLSRLDRQRSRRWLWWLMGLIGFCVLASGAAWAGFFILQPFREFHDRGLELSLDGPRKIVLGEEQTYTVHWSNAATTPLATAEVRVSLPFDFSATEVKPAPSDADLRLWKLGFLPVGSRGDIQVKGYFTGALGTQTSIQLISTYHPSNFSKEFESATSVAVNYEKSVLEGSIEAPTKLIAGDMSTFRYRLLNQGEQAMKDLVVRVSLPEGFLLQTTSSTARGLNEARDVAFAISHLAPNASTTIRWVGSFAAGSAGDKEFQVAAGRRDAQGGLIVYDRREAHVPVVPGDLAVQFVINGASTDRTIAPGDPLRIAIGYQNTSPEVLKNVALRIGFESFLNGTSTKNFSWLDWQGLDDESRGVSTTKAVVQTIRYAKEQISSFASLASQQDGRIELSIPTLLIASGTRDAAIRITVEAEVPIVGGTKVQRIVRTQPITVRYRSNVESSVMARYFTEEGAPLGFGPLPPVANKTTAYRLVWRVTKTFHALEEASFTAVLPKNAAWSARTTTDAGTMSYDPVSRTVRWSIVKIADEVQELEATFEVQLTPSTLDVGRFADLIGETRFQAKDVAVNEMISSIEPALSTDLQEDEGAKGKGVVRKD